MVEASTAGWAASGRNGGFCSASLTHGIGNGLSRFPDDMPRLEQLGAQNLDEIGATVAAHGIDCDFAMTGELAVATAPWQLDGLTEEAAAARALGHEVTELDAAGVRAELDSPAFLGGSWYRDTCAMVDPARLARGLRQACLDAGVRIYEHTPVRAMHADGAGIALTTPARRGCGPTRWSWPRGLTRPCCAGCGATSCRSTTTCSSPSRCPRPSWPASGGGTGRARPTAATSSTTSG